MENLEDSTKKLLELIHEFRKIAGYKDVQKSFALLYKASNEATEKIKKIDPIYNCTKIHKTHKTKPNQRCKKYVC